MLKFLCHKHNAIMWLFHIVNIAKEPMFLDSFNRKGFDTNDGDMVKRIDIHVSVDSFQESKHLNEL